MSYDDAKNWKAGMVVLVFSLFLTAEGRNCTSYTFCQCSFFSANDASNLLDIKAQITSDPFGVLSSWDASLSCDAGWEGVCCDSSGNVNIINLYHHNLAGTISDSVGNFVGLQALYLKWNNFSGPIPSSFGNVVSLVTLDLSFNQLSGPIPDTLGSLSQLQSLNLGANLLTGPIPDSLGRLVLLKTLSLFSNRLSGGISDNLYYLINLQQFYLFDNYFTGVLPSALPCPATSNFSLNCLRGSDDVGCFTGVQRSSDQCSQFYSSSSTPSSSSPFSSSSPSPPSSPSSSGKGAVAIIVVVVIILIIACAVVTGLIFFCRSKKRKEIVEGNVKAEKLEGLENEERMKKIDLSNVVGDVDYVPYKGSIAHTDSEASSGFSEGQKYSSGSTF